MGIFDRNGSGNGRRANGDRRPARYSAFDLIRHGISGADWSRAWSAHDLRPSYDAVIVGGGVHGLATAYYLAKKHGIIKIAEAGAEVVRVATRLAREGPQTSGAMR